MSDMLEQANAYETVTLVDRVGTGGFEFVFDGKRFVLKPGKPKLSVPRFVAEWLFRVDQMKVHTQDGQYVHRFGIEDGPEDLAQTLGLEPLDCTPIVLQTDVVEGWDVAAADPERAKATTINLKPRPDDFKRQGGPGGATFSGKER
jgi:hypothetical protein